MQEEHHFYYGLSSPSISLNNHSLAVLLLYRSSIFMNLWKMNLPFSNNENRFTLLFFSPRGRLIFIFYRTTGCKNRKKPLNLKPSLDFKKKNERSCVFIRHYSHILVWLSWKLLRCFNSLFFDFGFQNPFVVFDREIFFKSFSYEQRPKYRV